MEELKPCPFCGGKGRVIKTSNGRFAVGCDNLRDCATFPTTQNYANQSFAIAAWNRRIEAQKEEK